jgi:GPH family glycoside/pentoside/hexuronide:cation symporter
MSADGLVAPEAVSVAAQPQSPADQHAERSQALPTSLLAVYGTGAMVDAITTFFLSTLLYFYLTAVCGLSGTAAGGALAIALVVDSAIDPIVGSLSDNTRFKFGRRHPYMLGAVIPLLVTLGLLFSVPAGLKGAGLFAYALCLLLAIRVAISLFYVPFIALGAELTDDYRKRSTVVAFRVGIGSIGTLLAIVLAYGVFLKGPGGLLHRSAYTPLAWTCGLIVTAAALCCALGTLRVRGRLHQAAPSAGAGLGQFLSELNEVRRNSSFMVLFGACLLFFIAQGMASAMTLHANTFFWKLPTARIQIISMTAILGVFIGLPVMGLLSRKVEKRAIAMLGMSLICLAQFSPVLLRLAGIVPPTPGGAQAILMIAATVLGIGVTGATVGFQSMMADAADEHEHMFNARREGLYFAGITFSAKASSGIGVFIAGLAMDFIHFPNNIAAMGPNAVIAGDTIRNLGLLYGPGAAVVTFTGVLLLLFYRLNQQAHAAILAALAERRRSANDGAALARPAA